MGFFGRAGREGRVAIADNAYGNGGEMLLIRMLNRAHLLDEVAGYAGWNTSANTLGTAIAEGVDAYHFGITQSTRISWWNAILRMPVTAAWFVPALPVS